MRKPEPCSLGRATAFNATNLKEFYDNLEEAIKTHPSIGEAHRIYNLDETKLLTVQTSEKVFAGAECRRLNHVTSAERGTLTTGCCIICANGTYLPPILVFPRTNIQPYMTNSAPVGTLGLAQPTGWMNEELFLHVMKHFVKYSHSSKENPSLLIMDNHESHIQPDILDYASENGVVIVTIPPHCSHRLQPLDVCVYGSLQKCYNRCISQWMLNNPGKTVKIQNVPDFFNQAFVVSMTPSNIISAFKTPGIYPYNRFLFTKDDFMTSYVTDRPMPQPATGTKARIPATIPVTTPPQGSPVSTPTDESVSRSYVSPEEVMPYPKASPRRENKRERRRGKSMIATSTPEKKRIRERKEQTLKRKSGKNVDSKRAPISKSCTRKKVGKKVESQSDSCLDEDSGNEKECLKRPKQKMPDTNVRPKKAQRHIEESSSEDEPEYLAVSDTDMDPETFSDLEAKQEFQPDLNFGKDDFCVVEFELNEKSGSKHYVGKILEIEGENFKIDFMRKTTGDNTFVFLENSDIAWINKNRIVTKVNALKLGTTSRQNRKISFDIKLADEFPNFY